MKLACPPDLLRKEVLCVQSKQRDRFAPASLKYLSMHSRHVWALGIFDFFLLLAL